MKEPRNYAGMAIFVLAAGLGLGWAVTLIAAALSPEPFSPNGANFLNNIGSGMIGIIGAYVGAYIRARGERGKDDKTGGNS